MRVIAVSLLVAAPALVSAAVAPVRRTNTGYGTWYFTQTGNAGSCGSYLNDADYTVAMNSFQYNDGMCGKTISITANGKTTKAKVMDLCPNGGGNCNWGDVDMSPDLFSFFADRSTGKMAITWDFDDDSAPAPAPQPSPTTSQDYIPQVPSVPTTTSVTNDYVPLDNVAPTTTPTEVPTPVADAYVDPTPQPDTTTSCTDTTTDTPTSTESASVADVTPTPPPLGDQMAMAIQNANLPVLADALVQLGNMLKNSNTDNNSPSY